MVILSLGGRNMQIILAFVVIAALAVVGLGGAVAQKKASDRDARTLAYYEKTMLRKQGSALGFGSYALRSFDGGKMWYAVERGEEDELLIRGVAEDVFPGLLSHLEGMDALLAYVETNGPITFSPDSMQEDREVLQAAGFTVTEKE